MQTISPLTADIDITTDGEYVVPGKVKFVMTIEQADKLAEVLDVCVNRDVVGMEWGEPESATFVDMLVAAIREARA